MWLCRAGGEAARRRLTISDARIGYRMSGLRPGLLPVLHRASAHGRPPSVRREFPTVAPPPALHNAEEHAVAPVSELVRCYFTWIGYGVATVGSTWRAMFHKNPASSRAIAVVTTVPRLPLAAKRR